MNDSKKKRFLLAPKPPFASLLLYKWKFATVISMFIFIFLFHGHFPLGSQTFQPVLAIHPLTRLAIRSFSSGGVLCPFKGVSRVLFPDQVLLLVSKNDQLSGVDCVYSSITGDEVVLPVLSVDQYTDLESIVRCPAPPANHSAAVDLRKRGDGNRGLYIDQAVHSWDRLVYAAVIDGKTAAVFVKGLNLRADRASDASQFSCHFGWGNAEGTTRYVLTTRAITAAQEVIRCLLPRSLHMLPAKAHGVRVTIGAPSSLSRHSNRNSRYQLPSVAKLIDQQAKERNAEKYELCACTMVWNQAPSLREWIAYHAWLGIQRWFIYDNNSEDGINEVINELDQENYNVSRHVWPWIKTQEAGFSHCALQAKKECKWVAFIDVDEYYYIPIPTIYRRPTDKLVLPGRNSLRSVVAKYSDSATVGEIRTACHSFGPSGLNKIPPRGVTVGYTCRLQSPERHKSIVRPAALDETLLTVVHHFHLKPEFKSFNLPQSTAVINHYKYQVWESFRAKFFRRVATYVADWQENQNEGSKDRAPGLGTEAIEPPNWSRQFCEVWDTGLRDFIMSNLADENSGLLPWERPPP